MCYNNYIKYMEGTQMAQSTTIMAFRKRLKGRGYTNISIIYLAEETKNATQPQYCITAREPLAGEMVRRQCSELEMHYMFR